MKNAKLNKSNQTNKKVNKQKEQGVRMYLNSRIMGQCLLDDDTCGNCCDSSISIADKSLAVRRRTASVIGRDNDARDMYTIKIRSANSSPARSNRFEPGIFGKAKK